MEEGNVTSPAVTTEGMVVTSSTTVDTSTSKTVTKSGPLGSKEERTYALSAFTRCENKLCKEIEAECSDSKEVTRLKGDFDTAYERVVGACKKYISQSEGDVRTSATSKLKEVEQRKVVADNRYQAYLETCVRKTSSRAGSVAGRSIRSGRSHRSRRSVEALEENVEVVRSTAEFMKQRHEIDKLQDELEANRQERELEAQRQRQELEAQRKVKELNRKREELKMQEQIVHAQEKVRFAERYEDSEFGSDISEVLPLRLKQYAAKPVTEPEVNFNETSLSHLQIYEGDKSPRSIKAAGPAPTAVSPALAHRPKPSVLADPRDYLSGQEDRVYDRPQPVQQHQPPFSSFDFATPKIELDSFSGNVLQYLGFIRRFEEFVERRIHDNSARLSFLLKYCTGEALQAICGCDVIADRTKAYREARLRLHEKYNQPDILKEAAMDKIVKAPKLKEFDADGWNTFADDLYFCACTLSAGGFEYDLNSQDTIFKVLRRFPENAWKSYKEFANDMEDHGKTPTFEDVMLFVKRIAKHQRRSLHRLQLERDCRSKVPTAQYTARGKATRPGRVFAAVEKESNKRRYNGPVQKCTSCSEHHPLWQCGVFKSKTPQDRREHVKNKRLCFQCLRAGHQSRDCKYDKGCRDCGKRHNTLLHINIPPSSAEASAEPQSESAIVACNEVSHNSVKNVKRFKIVPVKVWGNNQSNFVETYAFLDDGSDTSICTASLAKKLGLKETNEHIELYTANSVTSHGSRVDSLYVKGINETESFNVEKLLVLDHIVNVSDSIPTEKVANMYPHLRDLKFPELKSKSVELLLGNNVHDAFRVSEWRYGKKGQPFGLHTALGWTLFGSDHNIKKQSQRINVNFMHEPEQVSASCSDILNVLSSDFHDLDCEQRSEMSLNDKRALKIMDKTVSRNGEHYEIGLPWKEEYIKLPKNRKMALQRLQSLKKKFIANPDIFRQYREKIDEYVKLGHATVLANRNCLNDITWYIPHHCTGPKFRIVFDCAAKHCGVSLNDVLLQGPDLTNSLVGVLLRFRQEAIALVADIKGMFHQVFVRPCDRDAMRFLWWPDNDLSRAPVDYQMNVHIFGATSSPSCASYALRKTADDNATKADKNVVNTIKRNFYVDDLLKSCKSVDDTVELISAISPLLKSGGFHLTKYISNNRSVLSSIPACDLASSVVNLDLHELPTERALGVYWNTSLDRFEVKVNVQTKPSTRRGILSMVSQVYDPLGFSSPFILPARKLLQKACSAQLGWDDLVPEQHINTWNNWLNTLVDLEHISIPRCFKPVNVDYCCIELHTFSDASNVGYGAVSYLRMIDLHGNIYLSFVMGKARVSPLKPVSVPRLELTAAVVAVKLSDLIRRELEYKIDNVYLWTDSTTVLQYITNTSTRFQTFVANRLEMIHSLSKPEQWMHVDTKRNPADIASRGLMPNELHKADLWFKGPTFLYKTVEHWPVRPAILPLLTADPEVKSVTLCNVVCSDQFSLLRLWRRYSSFTNLQRATAWILRYRTFLLWKVSQRKAKSNDKYAIPEFLSLKELNSATAAIVRAVQRQSFSEVINQLHDHQTFDEPLQFKSQQHLNKSKQLSTLRKLSPVLVKGIMYVGGRLHNSTVPLITKHPMILPSNHVVTELVVTNYHNRHGHSGTIHVLSAIRERFWILRGQATVRRILRGCRKCRFWSAKVGEQIMATLPMPRVTSNNPPFTCVGVDYMGPILTKSGRSQVKRYACIFTCMATRAIHIEVAQSLETSAFIDAYRRFSSRRLGPKRIYSDNGTNFVGAERELREGIRRWNKKQIHDALLQNEIDWSFNPPAASHQGGVWERMIRSVRKIMRLIMGETILDDFSLLTLMAEVERILNSRPLVPLSDDCKDELALTPSMLLKGAIDNDLPPDTFVKADGYRRSWRLVQLLADQFWDRWTKEYLPLLQLRQKWLQPMRNFTVGDVVLIVNENAKRGLWPKGIIEKCIKDKNGMVRRVQVRTAYATLTRDIRKICLLEGVA